MARLSDFLRFVNTQRDQLIDIEQKLLTLQEKYETFFQEVNATREIELKQLGRHILEDLDQVPSDLREELEEELEKAAEEFDAKLEALAKDHEERAQEAEYLRQRSWEAEAEVHQKNTGLDQEEEELKARNQDLLRRIESFNARILEMGSGWGFFRNFFRMRSLQKERVELDREQADVAARIEALRARWRAEEGEWAEQEEKYRSAWREKAGEAAALRTKLDYLTSSRSRIIQRTALEAVLYKRDPELREPSGDDPPCPRCQRPNPEGQHFCHICAKRLVDDRPDLEGSLLEIAEVNEHHQRFSKGMEACQGIIGLVRGLKSGHVNFAESVSDMISTENRYPVGALNIDVPAGCRQYTENFKKLFMLADLDQALHPLKFAGKIEGLISEAFTEDAIQDYFETMGKELSTQADRQW